MYDIFRHRISKHLLTGCALGAALSGCVGTFDKNSHLENARYQAKTVARYDLPSRQSFSRDDFISQTSVLWWQVFEDPLLNQLVERSMVQSFDVRRALADVERAEATVRGVQAGGRPSVNLSGEISQRTSDVFGSGLDQNTLSLGLQSSWDIDLFGGVRNNIKASQANLQAQQALQRDVQRLTVARTVQSYIAYRNAQARIRLAERNIERLTVNTGRIGRLIDGGYNTKLDLRRAESQVFELQANLSSLRIGETAALNALATLINTPPQVLARKLVRNPATELAIPVQIPAPDLDILTRHRPDIRQAQWSLLAATRGVDAARAGLYPSLNLSASSFFSGQNRSGLPELGSLSGELISGLAAPLFGRGRLLAAVDERRADVKRALTDYESAVFTAIVDIDNGMARWQRSNERLRYREAGLKSAVEAQELAERLFYAGESDFTASVLAEQSRLQAEDSYLSARNDVLAAYVEYVAAIVPGW